MFLLLVIILAIITIAIWSKIVAKHDLEALGSCITVVAILFSTAALISYSVSLDTIAKMKSFHDTNKFVYEVAIKEYPNSGRILTRNDATVVTTLPYDRIKLICSYNSNLTWYRMYQKHWFIGGFVGKVPQNLKYIVPIAQE